MTPSPESKTIPVDFPVANLNNLYFTMKERLDEQQIWLVLETFQKIFKISFFFVSWDSYWVLSVKQDARLGILLIEKMHVSIKAPYLPNFK